MFIPFATIEFTTGRIVFSCLFILAFVIVMFYSYKKDAKNNQKYYKNSALFVAIGILTAIALLFLAKYLIKG
ncbi:hypothetical protein [Tenacibaculum piscium]|uniref:hypothetical protein n=1 Tax=Tenacibaculum piscium TaxID=1458515 RepID=UPI001F209A4F|nr:hypothetical protein [Tenacibaculum piscium]